MVRSRGQARKHPYHYELDDNQRDAGEMVFELILGIYASKSAMSARQFCLICQGLAKCNTPGADWGKWGGNISGNCSGGYKRHLNSLLPGSGPYYTAMLPCSGAESPMVKSKETCFQMVWETMSAEISSSSSMQAMMETGAEDDPSSVMSLPVYLQHPLVQRARESREPWPIPLGLYLDGVRFSPISAGRTNQMD